MSAIWPDAFPGLALEHAAVIETSLWMHHEPSAVRTDRIAADAPDRVVNHDVVPIDTRMSTASGSLRAIHGPVALVHFDAHLDTWDTYFNAPVTHGTIFRRAFEEGLLVEDHSIHIGIRGPIYDRMDLNDDARMGFRIIRAGDLDVMGIETAVDVIERRVADLPVYLSVDIDVLDPAFAPGTGTPEAGGLTSRELLRMLRKLTGINIVGADVVEVAPAYDHAEITCVAAATVVFDILSLIVANGSDPGGAG